VPWNVLKKQTPAEIDWSISLDAEAPQQPGAMPDLHRRRLFVIENLVSTACIVAGLVLVWVVPSLPGKVAVALCLMAILVTQGVLRFTYFKNVIPEIGQEKRERRRSEGRPPVS
jgi:hypothetical protein